MVVSHGYFENVEQSQYDATNNNPGICSEPINIPKFTLSLSIRFQCHE